MWTYALSFLVGYLRELILFPSFLFLAIFLIGGVWEYVIPLAIFVLVVFFLGERVRTRIEASIAKERAIKGSQGSGHVNGSSEQ